MEHTSSERVITVEEQEEYVEFYATFYRDSKGKPFCITWLSPPDRVEPGSVYKARLPLPKEDIIVLQGGIVGPLANYPDLGYQKETE